MWIVARGGLLVVEDNEQDGSNDDGVSFENGNFR